MAASLQALKPLKAGSLKSRVVEALREAIFCGALEPGAMLRESRLAASMGVSQATVREALMTLEHAGLVVRDNRETKVTRLTAKDLAERSTLRVVLEGMAGVQAAARMTGEDFAALAARLEAIHRALDRDSYMDFVAADLDFHRFIWAKADNQTLQKTLELITVPVFAFLSIRRSRSLHNLVRTVRSHDPILEAMRSGREEAIREAFREHIEESYRNFHAG